jgi:hypothetical protein
MSKFVVVKEAPKDLKKGEYLIDTVSFITQIAQHKAKKPRSNLTERMYLDAIMNSIGEAYDAGNTDPHSNRVKYHNYTGILTPLDEQVNEVILRAIRSDCSHLLGKYLDTKIRNRPVGTQLVIYVDSNIQGQYEIFYKNGLSEQEKEVVQKPKSDKIVGKPAITKDEAEAKKNQVDSQ